MKILLLSRDGNQSEILPSLECFGDVTYTSDFEDLRSNGYSLVVSYCYNHILNEKTIRELGCRILNVHPSFLPYGRGIYPIMWSAALGHPFGATIHTIESKKIDAGRIIIQRSLPMDAQITLRQAHACLLSLSRSLLLESLVTRAVYAESCHLGIPDELIASTTYKSKVESMRLFSHLKRGWETTLEEVGQIYSYLYESSS